MYDAEQRRYGNHTDVVQMVKAGHNVKVLNHEGSDVTTDVFAEAVVSFSRFTNAETLKTIIKGF